MQNKGKLMKAQTQISQKSFPTPSENQDQVEQTDISQSVTIQKLQQSQSHIIPSDPSISLKNKQMSFKILNGRQQKLKWRQQGKELLLKGCYKMASYRYFTLIKNGMDQFSPRQRSIIFLNCGICFQFMDQKFQEALFMMKQAVAADPSYEKSYFRLAQLLRDKGYYEEALQQIPDHIKHPQLEEIKVEIRQKSLQESGLMKLVQWIKKSTAKAEDVEIMCKKLEKTILTLCNYVQRNAQNLQAVDAIQEKLNKLCENLSNFSKDFCRDFILSSLLAYFKKKSASTSAKQQQNSENQTKCQENQVTKCLTQRIQCMKKFCKFIDRMFLMRMGKKKMYQNQKLQSTRKILKKSEENNKQDQKHVDNNYHSRQYWEVFDIALYQFAHTFINVYAQKKLTNLNQRLAQKRELLRTRIQEAVKCAKPTKSCSKNQDKKETIQMTSDDFAKNPNLLMIDAKEDIFKITIPSSKSSAQSKYDPYSSTLPNTFLCIEEVRILKWVGSSGGLIEQRLWRFVDIYKGIMHVQLNLIDLEILADDQVAFFARSEHPDFMKKSETLYELFKLFKEQKLPQKYIESNKNFLLEQPAYSCIKSKVQSSDQDYQWEISQYKIRLQSTIELFGEIYQSASIEKRHLQILHQSILQLDSLIQILLEALKIYEKCIHNANKDVSLKQNIFCTFSNKLRQVENLNHLFFIRHWQMKKYAQLNGSYCSQAFSYEPSQLVQYFAKCKEDDFISTYLFEQIIQFILVNQNTQSLQQPGSNFKEKLEILKSLKDKVTNLCLQKMAGTLQKTTENSKDLDQLKKVIKQQGTQMCFQKIQKLSKSIYREIYLTLVVTLLKVNPKIQAKIASHLILFNNNSDCIRDISLQALLLVLANNPNYLIECLEHFQKITEMIKSFLEMPLIEKIQSFRILLNIIYILMCDFEHDKQVLFAKSMGTTAAQIHQARRIQGQTVDQKLKLKIADLRLNFKLKVSQQWLDILFELIHLCNDLSMEESCASLLCRIISSAAEYKSEKYYSTQIVQFMLSCRKLSKSFSPQSDLNKSILDNCCKFFQKITKQCNPQVFLYKHVQAIADCLLWQVQNSEHELNVFESLLGLVNLSTSDVHIKVQEIQKCLYQQNMYIMHAAVCILNNVLVHSNQFQNDEKQLAIIHRRISEVIQNYLEFYRDQVLNLKHDGRNQQLPESDYSHPMRVYVSLVSLATVLNLNKLEELKKWEQAKKYIKMLSISQGTEMLFKLVVYHSIQGTLPRNWSQDFKENLDFIKKSDPLRYSKIHQLIR